MHRREFIGLALPALATALPIRVSAQGRTIRVIIPFTAGSSADILTRLVADKMHAALDRAVVVENRTGGALRIGVVAVKHAAADGNTLLVAPVAPMTVYPHTYKSLDYDPFSDFAPISQLATFGFALAVGPQVPARSLAELVAWLKVDSLRAVYAGPSTGDLTHFIGVLSARAAGLDMRHVAYRGTVPAITDLMAGQIPIVISTLTDLVPMHQAKKVRILATAGKTRSPFAPEVPTFLEQGLDIEGSGWYGAFAPANTSPATIETLSSVMAAAVRAPELSERLRAAGLVPTGTSAAELAAIQRADSERWAAAVKISGFQVEE